MRLLVLFEACFLMDHMIFIFGGLSLEIAVTEIYLGSGTDNRRQ